MRRDVLKFFQNAFPFLATVFLWRMSGPVFNPGGVLAVILIFYSTFVRPRPGFAIFGIVMCFLLDYKFDSLLFWTSLYCFCYAANGFQNVIDLTRRDRRGIDAFAIFIGVAMTILFIMRPGWHTFGAAIWTTVWTVLMYTPITLLTQRVCDD